MATSDRPWELAVSERTAFGFVRVDAAVDAVCGRCGECWRLTFPVLCDWWDRRSAEEQARCAGGQPCPKCGDWSSLEYPVIQFRRGDVAGLLVGFPALSPAARDHDLIRDALAVADPGRLDGAGVVVSARLRWWDRLWAKPLGPVLVAAEPLVLPEGSEEVERWREDTVRALDLPDADRLLGEFVSTEDYPEAIDLVRSNLFLLLSRWQVTVDAIGERLIAMQTEDDARGLVRHRLGRLRQLRLVGIDRVTEADLTGELAQLANTATSSVDRDTRRSALRELDALLADAPANAMTAVVLNSLVASLHGDPSRAVLRDDELEGAARRAVAVALEVFGDQHLVTMSAQLNHAVVVEERADIPRGEALARAEAELLDLAPRAAQAGLPIVADVAVNLATIASQRVGSRADNPEEAAEFLADARHMTGLWKRDDPRHSIIALVDEAASVRARMTGPFRENARYAVELLDAARAMDTNLSVLSAPERVLLLGNVANSVYQLRVHAPELRSIADVAAAAREAIAAVATIDRLHQVAIDTLSNAGSILADAYSDTMLEDRADLALWTEARDALEDALDRASEVFPAGHPTRLRVTANVASVYGRAVDGKAADASRCERLLRTVIDDAPADRVEFAVVAATNLGQLCIGAGRWTEASDAYAVGITAQRRLVAQARTPLTKLGEVIATADLAARRALALGQTGKFADAIAVLEENRGQLFQNASARPSGGPASDVATVHLATCDYGTVVAVRLPDGALFGYTSPLTATPLRRRLALLLEADDMDTRRARLDELAGLLTSEVVDPVAAIVRNSIDPVDRLDVVACGPLAACPLHSIPDSDGLPWVATWDVAFRLAASATEGDEPPEVVSAALAIIDPEGDLPFAAAEREAMARALPAVREPPAGWSARAWMLAELPKVAVVHLACHARADPDDPMRSSITVGTDEDLTVGDLTSLDTTRLSLVVAPACQSAAASAHAPDELLGVAHALIHGGARTVVASLWDADDAATALVISRFYDELLAGASPTTALARAQRYTAAATPAQLSAAARGRLDGNPDAAWMPYDLAIEFIALTAHLDIRGATDPYFGHPADWAALTVLTR